jgi:hypothetical protein
MSAMFDRMDEGWIATSSYENRKLNSISAFCQTAFRRICFMTPHERLANILHEHPRSPFLFVGSGFSQRYLGIPTWSGLLKEFCGSVTFEYYFANADSKLPRAASLIAKDYAVGWWKAPEFAMMREKYKAHLTSSSSPIKIAISERIQSEFKIVRHPQLVDELQALRAFNAEGIITTNWDLLLESLFPGYKVYIGQQSIIRQTPQNVAEIYKIHGCCSDPNSLVLTEEDYQVFRHKQAYLAAKLITIFVEHPVLFIGYSISDPSILDLLRAILRGLGSEEIGKLQRNLIFLQRTKPGRPEGVKETIVVVDDTQLPITNLVTADFASIYAALAQTKLKLPARLLRFCKEQLYEIVSSKEPSDKLCLLNIDEITDKSEIEFVVGLGLAGTHFGERGYQGVSSRDLFTYVLFGQPMLDPRKVLEQALPALDTGNNFLPVYRFLKEAEAKPGAAIFNLSVQRLATPGRDAFKTKSYAKQALRETNGRDFTWIIEKLPPEKAAAFIPHLPDERISVEMLEAFVREHFEKGFGVKYSTIYRKLFCLYDCLKFGADFALAKGG